jgi:hypothetical protein
MPAFEGYDRRDRIRQGAPHVPSTTDLELSFTIGYQMSECRGLCCKAQQARGRRRESATGQLTIMKLNPSLLTFVCSGVPTLLV